MFLEDQEEEGVSTEALFPLRLFSKNNILETYTLAIPNFKHWFRLLGKNDDYFEFVINWIAKIINFPGDMSNICGLAFYSKTQGIEKSLAIKMTMSLLAPFTQETQSLERVFERFTVLMEFALLFSIEDVPENHLHKYNDGLKGCMTSEKIFIDKKNHPIYSVTNFCRSIIVFLN